DTMFYLLENIGKREKGKWQPITYINMAAACLLYSLKKPLKGFDMEVALCKTMCEAAKRGLIKHIIQISTSEVYGGGNQLTLQSPCLPRTTYAAAKLASDGLVNAYRQLYNIKASIIRPFNTYGPRQENAIIPATIKRILDGKKPIINGDGNQIRDYTYISDMAIQIVDYIDEGRTDDCIMASGHGYTVKEVIERVMKQIEYTGDIEYNNDRIGDVECLVSQQKHDNLVSIEIGINETIRWWRSDESSYLRS
ncbi:hypothetical protein LCGC14_2884670, partial [marine sediment metagenome]